MGTCASVDYKVRVSTTTGTPNIGTLEDYAWSPNIGWIKFAGDATHSNPTVYLDTGAVTGWIRACAGTVNGDCTGADRADGWDGWISLSDDNLYKTKVFNGTGGVTFDKSDGKFKGYAWGDVNVGWLTLSPSLGTSLPPTIDVICPACVPPPTTSPVSVTLTANPSTFTSTGAGWPGGTTVLTWTPTNATSCTASGGTWSGSKNASNNTYTESVSNITISTTYNITCINTTSGSTATANVTIIVNPCSINCGGGGPPPEPVIKLFIGRGPSLASNNITSSVQPADEYYPVKKPNTFDLMWVSSDVPAAYRCTAYTTIESTGDPYPSIWNGTKTSQGAQLSIPTANVAVDIYHLELSCLDPLVLGGSVITSNTVKLKVISKSAIIEER
jgi:hypothetical protein